MELKVITDPKEIVTDRPNGATHDRVNGASGRCVFSS